MEKSIPVPNHQLHDLTPPKSFPSKAFRFILSLPRTSVHRMQALRIATLYRTTEPFKLIGKATCHGMSESKDLALYIKYCTVILPQSEASRHTRARTFYLADSLSRGDGSGRGGGMALGEAWRN